MTTTNLYAALLRPAVIQILRATGFSFAKPVVIDSLTDFAARYMLLLGSCSAQNAFNTHNDFVPTIQDIRLALAENGALRPQMSSAEEFYRAAEEIDGELLPFEDLRGVQGFINWAQGPVNKEIRRIAGFGDEIDVNEIAAGVEEMEDYLTALKKKHSKTAEESRYQGTALGKEIDAANVQIVGGDIGSLSDWFAQQAQATSTPRTAADMELDAEKDGDGEGESPATSGISSAPPTPVGEEPEV